MMEDDKLSTMLDVGSSTKRKGGRTHSKPPRACDHCRRKKVRCDGGEASDGWCSQCKELGVQCSYLEGSTRRAPPKWYVEGLEGRIERLEALLDKLHPGVDFPELGARIEVGSWTNISPDQPARTTKKDLTPNTAASPSSTDDSYYDDESYGLENLKLENHRYYGPATSFKMFYAAMKTKPELAGQENEERLENVFRNRREYFWSAPPWERKLSEAMKSVRFKLPPSDLTISLINLYFEHSNDLFPLLHRPTFTKQYFDGLQERDTDFGALLLLVCAVGARYSEDPRATQDNNIHAAGWKYFEQVQRLPQSYLTPLTLAQLQVSALTVVYMLGCSNPQVSWSLVGAALRLATEYGLQTRKTVLATDPIEKELWRRVFWCLVALDRLISVAVGRPCAIQEHQIDLDMPLEVDDEFWIIGPNPEDPFVQPPNTPSKITFFRQLIDVLGLLHAALQDVTCPAGASDASKLQTLERLETQLSQWRKQLPPHLAWNPHEADSPFFRQSALLHTIYYQGFIRSHRSVLDLPGSNARTKCANAARSCARVLDGYYQRDPEAGAPWNVSGVFIVGLTLLLSMWGETGPESAIQYSEIMKDVGTCLKVLEHVEKRWFSGGMKTDGLRQLIQGAESRYPGYQGLKRSQPEDSIPVPPQRGHKTLRLDQPRSLPSLTSVQPPPQQPRHLTPPSWQSPPPPQQQDSRHLSPQGWNQSPSHGAWGGVVASGATTPLSTMGSGTTTPLSAHGGHVSSVLRTPQYEYEVPQVPLISQSSLSRRTSAGGLGGVYSTAGQQPQQPFAATHDTRWQSMAIPAADTPVAGGPSHHHPQQYHPLSSFQQSHLPVQPAVTPPRPLDPLTHFATLQSPYHEQQVSYTRSSPYGSAGSSPYEPSTYDNPPYDNSPYDRSPYGSSTGGGDVGDAVAAASGSVSVPFSHSHQQQLHPQRQQLHHDQERQRQQAAWALLGQEYEYVEPVN